MDKIVTYFMQGVAGGPIKIGKSTGVVGARRRLASCQTGNPDVLQLTRVVKGDWEKRLHWRFEPARLCGEWFAPVPDLARIAKATPENGMSPMGKRAYNTGFEDGWRAAAEVLAQSSIREIVEAHEKLLKDEFDSQLEDAYWNARQFRVKGEYGARLNWVSQWEGVDPDDDFLGTIDLEDSDEFPPTISAHELREAA